MIVNRCVAFVLVFTFTAAGPAEADVRLPSIFGSGMVLQENIEAPIWGWADPGEEISINASWMKSPVETKADCCGKWRASMKTPGASGPHSIKILGANKIELTDVLTGEVWLCSGQSNMALDVNSAANSKTEIAEANYPGIRFFTVGRCSSPKPETDCNGSWVRCSPQTVSRFSAVAYYFGRRIHKDVNVPVGLINASWGGTPAEAWTSLQVLQSDPNFAPILERYAKGVADFNSAKKAHAEQIAGWKHAVEIARAQNMVPPVKPYQLQISQTGPGHFQSPAGLYNAMINPIVPMGIKGVIWCQGECNVWRAYQYRKLFPALIEDWRRNWKQGVFPFYYVQLAPYDYSVFDAGNTAPILAELCEAQMLALKVPNTGMAVTMDIGDPCDIHPLNKQDVGTRLALWALAKDYGFKNVVYSGPIYKSMRIEPRAGGGFQIRLYFEHTGTGLIAKGPGLTEFTIAGADGRFVRAAAVIDNNTVIVFNSGLEKPVAARYAWSNTAVASLFNREGLPASSFRTDDWPCVTAGRN